MPSVTVFEYPNHIQVLISTARADKICATLDAALNIEEAEKHGYADEMPAFLPLAHPHMSVVIPQLLTVLDRKFLWDGLVCPDSLFEVNSISDEAFERLVDELARYRNAWRWDVGDYELFLGAGPLVQLMREGKEIIG